jgi:hypothetical protein
MSVLLQMVMKGTYVINISRWHDNYSILSVSFNLCLAIKLKKSFLGSVSSLREWEVARGTVKSLIYLTHAKLRLDLVGFRMNGNVLSLSIKRVWKNQFKMHSHALKIHNDANSVTGVKLITELHLIYFLRNL